MGGLCLANARSGSNKPRSSLKAAGAMPALEQSKVREPRENRGRLRHCVGLRVPSQPLEAPRASGKAGARFEAPSQDIPSAALVRSRPRGANFSDQEKDEASLSNRSFERICGMPSFSDGRRVRVFSFSSLPPRTGLPTVNPARGGGQRTARRPLASQMETAAHD
jgi:hypothetical protein